MSLSAPTLPDILREIDDLTNALPDYRVSHDVVRTVADDTSSLVGEMREWADTLSVRDSDQSYLATFHDALWWADTTLAPVLHDQTETRHQIRVLCRVLEELRSAVVLVRRDLGSR